MVVAAVAWRVGYHGIARRGQREGDGRIAVGRFGFRFFFGVQANPGFTSRSDHAYP